MRDIARLRWARVGLAVSTITGVALSLSPLLGAPGIESALVLGLLLPPFVAALAVRIAVLRVRAPSGSPAAVTRGSALTSEATLAGLAVFAAPTVILLLNTLRVPACGLGEGLAFLALGPGISVLLAAPVGVLYGQLIPRPNVATALAFFTPIVMSLVELYDFYATPAVYAYGHLVGYFPGTLYDPDITVTSTYLGFRVFSMAWLLVLHGLVVLVHHRRELRARWPLALAVAGLACFAIGGAVESETLGHQSSVASIEEALGGRIVSARCVVVFPRELPRQDAERLAEDCDFRVAYAESLLSVTQQRRVTAFFFRNPDEKRALMGASNTYIAKPWREEVYLQISEWPHPVLFHEVVHVVAGNVGRGPFRISGTLGGLLPSPAIIEGTAVAIAWDGRDGLTPHQWARAMLELDLAPPLTSVDGLSFLLQPASRAYTTSGSFLRWIMETRGVETLRRIYTSGDLEEALGEPLEEAEAAWHEFLRTEVALPEEARALAQRRFEQPGIFGQICPHRIANLRDELGADLAAGDDRAAVRTCGDILALDPGQTAIRAALVASLARMGERERAESELDTLVGPPAAAPPVIQRARMDLADALFKRGDIADARAIYDALAEEPMEEDTARQIEVRRLALDMGEPGRRALLSLLVPRMDMTQDAATAMHQIAHLGHVREDGLAAYLESRQLMFRQRYDLAWPRIRQSRRRGLPTDRLAREARRMEAIIAFGAGHLDEARDVLDQIANDPSSTAADRVEVEDWRARIRYVETGALSP